MFHPITSATIDKCMKTNEKIIEVKNLMKVYGSFTANNNLSFDVFKGEIFGFLGANGAGKTTAMRILCGLSLPTSGSVKVGGFDVSTESEKVKKNIGYMSQKFSLYDDLTLWENMRLYSTIYGVSKADFELRANISLERLNLQESRNKLIASLSLGLKQKLAFSVAIIHKPAIVFLDEPTGGVDPITRRQFWEMIYEEAAAGLTVFVTTHYMDEAEYCDRITIMVDGRIDALDTPKNLKTQFGCANIEDVFLKLARTAKAVE